MSRLQTRLQLTDQSNKAMEYTAKCFIKVMGTGERWDIFNNHLLDYVQTQSILVQWKVSVLHAKYNVFEELNSENKGS